MAVAATLAGDGPVVLFDGDTQGTATGWHTRRHADTPELIDVPLPRLGAALDVLRARGVAWCFLDTAPSRSDDTLALCQLADLVVVPVIPSPADLWSVTTTIGQLDRRSLRYLFALNQCKPNAAATAQTAAVLSERGTVARTFLGHRTGYAMAFVSGQSPAEIAPKSPAAEEVRGLWTDIRNAINRKMENA